MTKRVESASFIQLWIHILFFMNHLHQIKKMLIISLNKFISLPITKLTIYEKYQKFVKKTNLCQTHELKKNQNLKHKKNAVLFAELIPQAENCLPNY